MTKSDTECVAFLVGNLCLDSSYLINLFRQSLSFRDYKAEFRLGNTDPNHGLVITPSEWGNIALTVFW